MLVINEIQKVGLETFIEKHSLEICENPDGRVILNYSQINSPKHLEEVKECRGLVIEKDSLSLVARSFKRFFNLGEEKQEIMWGGANCLEKVDGSLILVYCWNNSWHVNTRGSFGAGTTNGKTWGELVRGCLDFSRLDPALSYSFELCSPYNQVVRLHPHTHLYFLSAFRGEEEIGAEEYTEIGRSLAVKGILELPQLYTFNSWEDIDGFLAEKELSDKTFEGVVVRDITGLRIKVKSKSYLRIHRLSNNGSVVHPKNIVPIILANEQEEILSYYPTLAPRIKEVEEILEEARLNLFAAYTSCSSLESQKEFALSIKEKTPLSSLAFTARKTREDIGEVWKRSGDILVRNLFKEPA